MVEKRGVGLGVELLNYFSVLRPYVDARASFHGINMEEEIGFAPDNQNEYKCRPCIHMDAYRYVTLP